MERVSGGYVGTIFVIFFGGVGNGVKIQKCMYNIYCPYPFLT